MHAEVDEVKLIYSENGVSGRADGRSGYKVRKRGACLDPNAQDGRVYILMYSSTFSVLVLIAVTLRTRPSPAGGFFLPPPKTSPNRNTVHVKALTCHARNALLYAREFSYAQPCQNNRSNVVVQ